MRFFGQAANSGEDEHVDDEPGGQHPEVSVDGREYTPAEHKADSDVGDNRQEKIHVQDDKLGRYPGASAQIRDFQVEQVGGCSSSQAEVSSCH